MTRQDAITMYNTNWWVGKSDYDIVKFQLFEDKLCMPFSDFHAAVESVLDTPIFTHQFANPESLREMFKGIDHENDDSTNSV